MVQYLQFRYQKGVLYRLKALGERHNMDITIEGFHSWMWRGLSFLLPFLFAGYVFQAYNAYVLFNISYHKDATWQVFALSAMFAVLFVGNTVTTLLVVPQKMREQVKERYRLMSVSWSMKTRRQIRVCMGFCAHSRYSVVGIRHICFLQGNTDAKNTAATATPDTAHETEAEKKAI